MEWYDKNSAAIIAASAALIASTIAGTFALLGAWLNHRFSNKRYEEQKFHDAAKDNKRLYLEKGEELHSLLTKWGNSAFAERLSGRGFIEGGFTKEQSLEFLKDKQDFSTHQRIKTLIDIYFNDITVIFNSARTIPLAAGDIKDAYERGELMRIEAYRKYEDCFEKFDPLLEKIQAQLQTILLRQLNE